MALSKKDLTAIQQLIDNSINGALASFEISFDEKINKKFEKQGEFMLETFATKQMFYELKEEISHLPTKEDYYSTMDKLVGELQQCRDEHTFLNNRIERVELHLGL